MGLTRDKVEGLFFGISNYVYMFLIANLYFLVTNIFFIEVFLVVDLKFETLPIYFLSLILTGPSLTAICTVMRKIIDKSITNLTKEFFKAYKDNFKISLKIWLPLLTLLTSLAALFYLVGYINGNHLIGFVSIIFFFILLGISFYVFPILSKFDLPYVNYYFFSLYYLMRRPTIYLSMLFVVGVVSYSIMKISFFFMLFATSIPFYAFMFFSKKMLEEIEQKIVKEN